MRDQAAILTSVNDPTIGEESTKFLGYGEDFPEDVADGFMFTLLKDGRKHKYIWDETNGVWQVIGSDHNLNLDSVPAE